MAVNHNNNYYLFFTKWSKYFIMWSLFNSITLTNSSIMNIYTAILSLQRLIAFFLHNGNYFGNYLEIQSPYLLGYSWNILSRSSFWTIFFFVTTAQLCFSSYKTICVWYYILLFNDIFINYCPVNNFWVKCNRNLHSIEAFANIFWKLSSSGGYLYKKKLFKMMILIFQGYRNRQEPTKTKLLNNYFLYMNFFISSGNKFNCNKSKDRYRYTKYFWLTFWNKSANTSLEMNIFNLCTLYIKYYCICFLDFYYYSIWLHEL